MARDWQPDFERLLEEHQSMVFSLAMRMTCDRGLAEEIAQDVFLALDGNLKKIESPEHALYWLRRVTMSRKMRGSFSGFYSPSSVTAPNRSASSPPTLVSRSA